MPQEGGFSIREFIEDSIKNADSTSLEQDDAERAEKPRVTAPEIDCVFGNHAVTDRHVAEIRAGGYGILAGELRASNTLKFLEDPSLVARWSNAISLFEIPMPTNVTREELTNHFNNIRSLVESGVAVAITDGYAEFEESEEKTEQSLRNLRNAALIGVAARIGFTIKKNSAEGVQETGDYKEWLKRCKNRYISRRHFLRVASSTASLLAATGVGLRVGSAISSQIRKRGVFPETSEPVSKAVSSAALNALSSSRGDFDEDDLPDSHEIMILYRNAVMSLNSTNIAAISETTDHPKKPLLFAGSGHAGIRDLQKRDFSEVAEALRGDIENMLLLVPKKLLDEGRSAEDIQNELFGLMHLFAEPTIVGDQSAFFDLKTAVIGDEFPPSARTVLFQEVTGLLEGLDFRQAFGARAEDMFKAYHELQRRILIDNADTHERARRAYAKVVGSEPVPYRLDYVTWEDIGGIENMRLQKPATSTQPFSGVTQGWTTINGHVVPVEQIANAYAYENNILKRAMTTAYKIRPGSAEAAILFEESDANGVAAVYPMNKVVDIHDAYKMHKSDMVLVLHGASIEDPTQQAGFYIDVATAANWLATRYPTEREKKVLLTRTIEEPEHGHNYVRYGLIEDDFDGLKEYVEQNQR